MPDALFEAMHRSPVITLDAPMSERVRLCREDYPHFADDPMEMERKLEPLKPLVGKETLEHWRTLASEGRMDELFESIMVRRYDPCYERSTRKNYGDAVDGERLELTILGGRGVDGGGDVVGGAGRCGAGGTWRMAVHASPRAGDV